MRSATNVRKKGITLRRLNAIVSSLTNNYELDLFCIDE